MKREKLLEQAYKCGAVLVRHGKKHDIYENPLTSAIYPKITLKIP